MTTTLQLGRLAESGGELKNGFTAAQIAATITPNIQELILLPTEQCNFRCTYCYEDFVLGRMSEATQTGIERLLDRRVPSLTALRFSWFGGEPLAAKDIVLRLSRYAHELTEKHGVEFSGGLTTNAFVLNRKLFEDFLDCRQDFFQITLDGWGETHNEVRRLANGNGTFDRIWSNLVGLRSVERPFEILLRIHVRRQNLDNLEVLMDRLGAEFANDERFRLDFEHLRNLGGPGGATITEPVQLWELPEIDARLRAIYDGHRRLAEPRSAEALRIDATLVLAKQVGESAGGQRASDLALGGNYICYAAKANSLLVRSNGRIGKCTVALNDDRNDIGFLTEDGRVQIDNDKLRPWLRGLSDLEIETLGCPLATLPIKTSPPAAAPLLAASI